MKNAIVSLLLLTTTLSVAHAQRFPGPGPGGPGGPGREGYRELRMCERRSEALMLENISLTAQLNKCADRHDERRTERLEIENRELRIQVDSLASSNTELRRQNDNLKVDVNRLEEELRERDRRDGRGGEFNLAHSIQACGLIANSVYSQNCVASAKKYSIKAIVINECAKIPNNYYAASCVESAGTFNTNARQVSACLGIKNEVYSLECVKTSGKKQLHPDIINSCLSTSDNSYYQLECVNKM